MTSILIPPDQELFPGRKRWTYKEVDELISSGILVGRYELIDGEIIDKMGQKPLHMSVIMLVMKYLLAVFGADSVRIQGPILIPGEDGETNSPEPDVAVTREASEAFRHRHPMPADLLLLVEVSDTTLPFDLNTKALLYARSSIQEYWVVNIRERQIHVHRTPTSSGYTDILVLSESAPLAPLARPDAMVVVGTLLPPHDGAE